MSLGVSVASTQELKKMYRTRDVVMRGYSEDGHFRVAIAQSSKLALEAQTRHEVSPEGGVLLARALTAAVLMSSFLKGEERVLVEAQGAGPIKRIYAEAAQVGEVRGYVEEPKASIDFSAPGASLSDLLGIGVLKVTRILYQHYEPTVGIVELAKGDISTDLAYYLSQSEQIPSAVRLDVGVDSEGRIESCAGIIVQAMPGAPQKEIQSVHEALTSMEAPNKLVAMGYMPVDIAKMVLPFPMKEIETTPVDFFCRCSIDRFKDSLVSLGEAEIADMQAMKQNELVCRYCNEHYFLGESDFEELLKRVRSKKN